MRTIKRILTLKQQQDREWRAPDKWSRAVIREIGRLGYDVASNVHCADGEPGRVYFTNVGAKALTVIVSVEPNSDPLKVLRVVIGRESLTARQAASWLAKRAPRTKQYL